MALTEAIQDYLEKLYWFKEAGIEPTQANLARAMQVSQPSVTEMVRRLVDEGLVERDERKRLHFTAHGEEVASHIVSRHRLIEAFLVKVFGIPWDEVHEEAHTFEHAISPNLEQRMYELLADAETCPHGHPIGDAPREPGERLAGARRLARARPAARERGSRAAAPLQAHGRRAGRHDHGDRSDDDLLTLETRVGSQTVPVPAAQTVSVVVEERGDGPVSDAADLSAEAMLSGTSLGHVGGAPPAPDQGSASMRSSPSTRSCIHCAESPSGVSSTNLPRTCGSPRRRPARRARPDGRHERSHQRRHRPDAASS